MVARAARVPGAAHRPDGVTAGGAGRTKLIVGIGPRRRRFQDFLATPEP
jgi:hypothetical protein